LLDSRNMAQPSKDTTCDFDRLMDLLGFENHDDLKAVHCKWVESALQPDNMAGWG